MKLLNIKLVIIILLGSIFAVAQSPNITELEYYFDNDPGFGNGTSVIVSPDSITSTTFDLNISSLDAGTHYAFIRAKDENGAWSFVHKMIVEKVETIPVITLDDIVSLEYFFDTDPGFGNGTPVAVIDGNVTSTSFDIDISGLDAGYHKVYFRTRDENGTWSLIYVQNVVKVLEESITPSTDIVAMEYFFDTDPGFGNGTSVPVTSDTVISTAFDIDVSGLEAGYHKVYFRTKNENRIWSLAYIQNLVKVSVEPLPESPEMVALEYFFDTDPGFGNGTELTFSPDSLLDLTFNTDLTGVSPGDHNMYIRMKDENNSWSLINVLPFTVSEVELTAFLEDPFNGSDMNTDLNSGSNLPLNQPFNTPPWNYTGTESVESIQNINVLDWILVETRNADDASEATGSTTSSRFATFILNDGSIVDLDGTSDLQFNAHTDTNNFLVIHHRNHLGVLSAEELTFSGGTFNYDFTTGSGQAYNSGQKDLGGVWGMLAGNADGNGEVHQDDINNVWSNQAGENGYYSGDMDMNNEVNNQDKDDVWLPNAGLSSQVPE